MRVVTGLLPSTTGEHIVHGDVLGQRALITDTAQIAVTAVSS